LWIIATLFPSQNWKNEPHWLQTQCHPVSAFEDNLSTLYWKAAMSMQYVLYVWWYRGEGPESRTYPSPTTCLFSSTAKISRWSNGHDYIVVRKLLPLVQHALQKTNCNTWGMDGRTLYMGLWFTYWSFFLFTSKH